MSWLLLILIVSMHSSTMKAVHVSERTVLHEVSKLVGWLVGWLVNCQ